MNRRLLALSIGLGALAAGRLTFAQEEVTIGYGGLPYKSGGESNTGIQLSDSVLLHAGIGVEAGYDSNVFYSHTDAIGSGIIRVMPYLEITNATRTGPASKLLTFDLRAGLQYRRYTSDNPDVQLYSNAYNPNAGVSIGIGGGQLSFGFADIFARVEDPPYQSQVGTGVNQAVITRNNNQASVELRWSPGGGRLTGLLRYTNMVDLFDGSYSYANGITNTFTLDASWRWLPKTAIFFDAQQGYIFYVNQDQALDAAGNPIKSSSFPLRLTVGLRGLLTERTSAILSLGYTNGFYSDGTSTGGFLGSTFAELAFTFKPTQLSRVVVGFRHDFINSVISNFAYEETAYASYVQQLIGRLALDLSARYAYLNYQGNFVDPTQDGRRDHTGQVGASFDYFMRNWAYIGVGYSLVVNSSNIPINSYVKNQVFARLGVTY